jgi:zinc protease
MNRTVRVAAEATLALLITASSLWAQDALPRGVVRVASVEGITEYRLENGLRTLIMPDPSKGIITVNIVYQVGSRHEDYGETGMAHLIEHLMSIGSTRHPDAKREQSERGAQRNASTWFDRTNYYEIFPSSPDNLTWALDLEADRMVNASITRDLLNSQMSVVRNEFEIGENNPARVLEERVFSTAFLWHNYGKSTIGARTDIERVPIERLQAFYRKYYRPDNAVLIVAGRLDERTAIDVVAAKFGGIRAPEQPVPLTYTEEPVQDGERSVMLRRVGDLQHLTMAFHIPAAAHADVAAMELVTDALTAAPAGRLHKALVEKTLATEVSGNVHTLREAGLVVLNVNVRKDVPLDRVRDAMLAELARLSTDGLSPDEVERSRARLLKTIDLAMAESDREASLLVEWIAAGDWRLMFLDRDRLRRVTVDEVRAVASNYLKASNRTIGQFIPEDAQSRSEIPATPSLT